MIKADLRGKVRSSIRWTAKKKKNTLEEYPDKYVKPEIGKLRLNFGGQFWNINIDLEALYMESRVEVMGLDCVRGELKIEKKAARERCFWNTYV